MDWKNKIKVALKMYKEIKTRIIDKSTNIRETGKKKVMGSKKI